jgi:hypothetical protein
MLNVLDLTISTIDYGGIVIQPEAPFQPDALYLHVQRNSSVLIHRTLPRISPEQYQALLLLTTIGTNRMT